MMKESDLTVEEWREYDYGGRVYRIEWPVKLYLREGGKTHRVLDKDGVIHCMPAPGEQGCVLRWKSKDPNKPVEF